VTGHHGWLGAHPLLERVQLVAYHLLQLDHLVALDQPLADCQTASAWVAAMRAGSWASMASVLVCCISACIK
jgi:hypothetical protein